jgi:hypothetical protein
MDSGDESVAEMGAHHHELQRVGAFIASVWDSLGLSGSSSIIDNSDVARIGWSDEVTEGVWHMSRWMAVSRPSARRSRPSSPSP